MTRAIAPPLFVKAGALAALALCSAPPVTAATVTAFASMHDAFGTTPNVVDAPPPLTTNQLSANHPLAVDAVARDPETGGGGTASARGRQIAHDNINDYVEFGVAAAARSQGNRVGSARASVFIDFEITVEIQMPGTLSDPIYGPLVTFCLVNNSCDLSVDFLHQTTGRFSYSSFLTSDAGAQFSESVSINGRGSAGVATVSGTQRAGSDPIAIGVGGAWQLDDFLPDTGAPGEGALVFNHFAFIDGVQRRFEPANKVRAYTAIYIVEIAQEAIAGFGSSDYAFGSVAADFAHTSRFSVTGIHDPVSGLDLSGLDVKLSFRDLTTVPLPAPIGLLAPALLGLAACARRRSSVRAT